MNEQIQFAEKIKKILETDKSVIGLAVAGSWLTNDMDEFSDLDLIIVTKEKITNNKKNMLEFARRFGDLLSGFTGEHVGEPRVLICLYADPFLHVDIKFVTLEEFHIRIETPDILFDTDGQLKNALSLSVEKFPFPDYQWMEDRFWIWVHYALLKIGRGEYLEAFDFFGFLRMVIFGPLLHIKNNHLPRGVRKVETQINNQDLNDLKLTLPVYEKQSLIDSLRNSIVLYRKLRTLLFDNNIVFKNKAEQKVVEYFYEIEQRKDK